MKTLGILEKSKNFWFLFVNLVLFFFLRFPSLFEPNWYGDEGVYQTLGLGLNRGRLLYQGVFDNKPPLLYIFYGLFNGDQFSLRLLSLVFGLLAVIAFFYLAKKIFKNRPPLYVSTFIFTLLFGLPVLEGNIANAENFMLFFILTAFYLTINHFRKGLKNKKLFWGGVILGIAFLLKIVAVFDFAALFVFLLIVKTPENFPGRLYEKLLSGIKNLYWLAIGFLIPISACAIFFFAKGAFSDFITATLFSNIGYVGYGNKLIIPQGFLLLKLIILAAFVIFIFSKRHKLTMATILIWIWLGFSVFNALFSQRPYTHYLLTLLPSISLLIGLVFEEKKLQRLNTVFILVILILVFENFWFYTKDVAYYRNFIDFVSDKKSVTNYQRFFDKKTPIDYEIARYIIGNTSDKDTIFIWGNNPQLYKLTGKLPPGKYTVAYHIQNYKDGIENTAKGIKTANPKLIILMPNIGAYPFSLSSYKSVAIIDKVYIYERNF